MIGSDARLKADSAPPILQSATALPAGDGTVLYLAFSEAVSEASAVDLAHYAVSPAVTIRDAQWDYHFRQVILRTERLDPAQTYAIGVRDVRDLAGNALTATLPVRQTAGSAAADAYATYQGKHGWFYEQYNPKPTQTYNNRKDILPPPLYWLANYYPAPDGECWLGHDEATAITQDAMTAGDEFHAVRTWMAPADGTVTATGQVRASAAGAARVRVVHNVGGTRNAAQDRELWQADTLPAAHDLSVTVTRGDVIRFILESGAVQWAPTVRYTAD